jgi:hypothetical protein
VSTYLQRQTHQNSVRFLSRNCNIQKSVHWYTSSPESR